MFVSLLLLLLCVCARARVCARVCVSVLGENEHPNASVYHTINIWKHFSLPYRLAPVPIPNICFNRTEYEIHEWIGQNMGGYTLCEGSSNNFSKGDWFLYYRVWFYSNYSTFMKSLSWLGCQQDIVNWTDWSRGITLDLIFCRCLVWISTG
jgi:hypothetical protein